MQDIILASSSVYRRQLLNKLGINYRWQAPDVDETSIDGESPAELVKRLSRNKAVALAPHYPSALIIGSDQVAALENRILGKPGNHTHAKTQLQLASGKQVTFFTGLTLYNATTRTAQTCCELYQVTFRQLTDAQIENYLQREQPYDCAGSFKSEGLGIALFDELDGRDPNTLIGLPLIALIKMLNNEGIDVLDAKQDAAI